MAANATKIEEHVKTLLGAPAAERLAEGKHRINYAATKHPNFGSKGAKRRTEARKRK